jgi:hypothetical protein
VNPARPTIGTLRGGSSWRVTCARSRATGRRDQGWHATAHAPPTNSTTKARARGLLRRVAMRRKPRLREMILAGSGLAGVATMTLAACGGGEVSSGTPATNSSSGSMTPGAAQSSASSSSATEEDATTGGPESPRRILPVLLHRRLRLRRMRARKQQRCPVLRSVLCTVL